MKCVIHSKALSNVTPSPLPSFLPPWSEPLE
jgi:hypothetical protein